MSKCKQCGAEYQAKRSDSQYCCSTCRSRAKRGTNATDKSLAVATANKEAVRATDDVRATTDTQPSPVCNVDTSQHTSIHEDNLSSRGINHCNTGPYKSAHELGNHEVNRVSLPGDADYVGDSDLNRRTK